MLLRVGAAIPLICFGIAGLAGGLAGALGQSLSIDLRLVAAAGGVLLLLGLWTPVAGMVVAIDQVWNAFLAEPRTPIWTRALSLCVLGAFLQKMSRWQCASSM